MDADDALTDALLCCEIGVLPVRHQSGSRVHHGPRAMASAAHQRLPTGQLNSTQLNSGHSEASCVS